METQDVIGALNRILALEYAGVIQYSQHSFLVQDLFREVYAEYFWDNSRECHGHAHQVGEMISGLGGVPTVEPAAIRQATALTGMLQQDLALEREALQAYLEAIDAAADHVPLCQMLEHMADDEQRAVWHLEKILQQKDFTVAEGGSVTADRMNQARRLLRPEHSRAHPHCKCRSSPDDGAVNGDLAPSWAWRDWTRRVTPCTIASMRCSGSIWEASSAIVFCGYQPIPSPQPWAISVSPHRPSPSCGRTTSSCSCGVRPWIAPTV